MVDIIPHCGGENDTAETIVSTQLFEYSKVLHCGSAKSNIRNAVKINDPSQLHIVFIGRAQPIGDLVENIGVRFIRVIKSGSIN